MGRWSRPRGTSRASAPGRAMSSGDRSTGCGTDGRRRVGRGTVKPSFTWPRRAFGALGLGQVVPGLAHTGSRAARRRGRGRGTPRRPTAEARGRPPYAEKNWGPGFAGRWWWGQTDFPGRDVGVASAGGRLPMPGVSAAPTAVVVRVGERVLRFVPPFARVRVSVDSQSWHVQARSPRHRLELEGEAGGQEPTGCRFPTRHRRVDMRRRSCLRANCVCAWIGSGTLLSTWFRGWPASSSGSRLAKRGPLLILPPR